MPSSPIDFVAIGATLQAARHARGWTQDDVARRLSLSGMAVSLIERGKSHGIETIGRYASLLGCGLLVHVPAAPLPDGAVRLLTAWARLPDAERELYLDIIEARASKVRPNG